MKILRIKITRARARQAIPASTVKLVSSRVTFLLYTNSVCLLINLQSSCQDVFEDAMVEAKAKAKSFRIKATYAYEILHD